MNVGNDRESLRVTIRLRLIKRVYSNGLQTQNVFACAVYFNIVLSQKFNKTLIIADYFSG